MVAARMVRWTETAGQCSRPGQVVAGFSLRIGAAQRNGTRNLKVAAAGGVFPPHNYARTFARVASL